MENQEEIWKPIIGYEGHYEVSSRGRLASLKGNKVKIIKTRITKNGYELCDIYKNNTSITLYIHRITAIHFINNELNKNQVNHKDGNKLNNNISNLEWCSGSENQKHAYRIGLMKKKLIGKYGINHPCSKPIMKYDLNGIFIKEYNSTSDAVRETGLNNSNISCCLNGKQKTCGGYIWKFKIK